MSTPHPSTPCRFCPNPTGEPRFVDANPCAKCSTQHLRSIYPHPTQSEVSLYRSQYMYAYIAADAAANRVCISERCQNRDRLVQGDVCPKCRAMTIPHQTIGDMEHWCTAYSPCSNFAELLLALEMRGCGVYWSATAGSRRAPIAPETTPFILTVFVGDSRGRKLGYIDLKRAIFTTIGGKVTPLDFTDIRHICKIVC